MIEVWQHSRAAAFRVHEWHDHQWSRESGTAFVVSAQKGWRWRNHWAQIHFFHPWLEVVPKKDQKKGGGVNGYHAHRRSKWLPQSWKLQIITLTCPFGRTNIGGMAAQSADMASRSITRTSDSGVWCTNSWFSLKMDWRGGSSSPPPPQLNPLLTSCRCSLGYPLLYDEWLRCMKWPSMISQLNACTCFGSSPCALLWWFGLTFLLGKEFQFFACCPLVTYHLRPPQHALQPTGLVRTRLKTDFPWRAILDQSTSESNNHPWKHDHK